MRTIKFRAWYQGRMYSRVEHSTFADGSSGVTAFSFEDSGFGHIPDGSEEVMQFIGIQDKNKKDIYEADILKTQYGTLLEVRWNVTGFGFWNYERNTWQLLYASDLAGVEVIGNIYEQPELIPSPA